MKTNFAQLNWFARIATSMSLLLASWVLAPATARACGDYSRLEMVRLAGEALSEDAERAAQAIAELRRLGPPGLDAIFALHGHLLESKNPSRMQPMTTEELRQRERLYRALDQIGQQRDCAASRLYWFTSLDQAKEGAVRAGKPILSLRLLGRLDEELSCANSRFFRTALYANAEVSKFLRERFILHWESVRPVPRITIDFGDGRKLERTITGNSIHYVLDASGRPIDALPGLYGPKAFLRALASAGETARQFTALPETEREAFLRAYHAGRVAALSEELRKDLAAAGSPPTAAFNQPVVRAAIHENPNAGQAARLAVGKGRIEMPVLARLEPNTIARTGEAAEKIDDATWQRIGALHAEDSRLDAGSRRLMARKMPDAMEAGRRAISKTAVEDPLVRAVREFEGSMAQDTVRNEYILHARVHEWFAAGRQQTRNVSALNERVYAELFLTPGSDPWLGLKPSGVYSAIQGDGITAARTSAE